MTDVRLSSVVGGRLAPSSLPVRAVVDASTTAVSAFGLSTDQKNTVGDTAPVDITGSGTIQFIGLHNGSGSTVTASHLKITIDGVEVYDETGSIANIKSKIAVGWIYGTASFTSGGFQEVPYFQSLKIEYASDATNLLNLDWMFTPT